MPIDRFDQHESLDCPKAGRILVVDDDPQLLKFASRVLAGSWHQVTAATGTEQACQLLREGEYDVLFADLEMPGRDGVDLLRHVGTNQIDVLPVLLTGTQDVAVAVAAMKHGAFDYIPKPVDPDVLVMAADRAVAAVRARRRETRLAREVGEWSSTFDACPDLLLVVDESGRIIRLNTAAERRSRVGEGRAVGRTPEEVFPGGLGQAVMRARGAPASLPARVVDRELGGQFLLTANPVAGGSDSPRTIVVVRDITTEVRDEEVRTQLSRQLVAAQETERGRIAKELHDGIGQSLASLKVGLAGLAHLLPDGAPRERLSRLEAVASETLQEIRRMAHGLRPSVLDDLGLVSALSRLTETFSVLHDVRAELIVPDRTIDRLPSEIELNIYRIVQEAMTNVVRHTTARTIDVVLEIDKGQVRVTVTDDGEGFAAEPGGDPGAGLGLYDMRERADLLGGTCQISSRPGTGTTVDVIIPLRKGEV